MSRLIFLDFDGCLNSDEYLTSDRFKEETKGIPDAELYLTKYELCLDPQAIAVFNQLVDRSQATVVASTSHRNRFKLVELNNMLTERGATFILSDKTPRLLPKKMSLSIRRGEEIQDYLHHVDHPVDGFVIIDDQNDMVHLTNHLVLIDYKTGFKPHHIAMAMRVLDGKRK